MPRIDPSQLLRTLSQLLSPDGGIRSAEEVPRIVKLMQKFSKKLVSKCIYIHILRASDPDLLEQFLIQKGWDLLNLWFMDSISSQNWYLCGDLVKLFAVCPMNPARLKENVEQNQAPKLIRQLSIDHRLDVEIRNQAQQVLQQWMSVIRAPPQPPLVEVSDNITKHLDRTSSKSNSESSNDGVDSPPEDVVVKKKEPVSKKKVENISFKTASTVPKPVPTVPKAIKLIPAKPLPPTETSIKRSSSDESVDVDDLLGGSSDEEEERKPVQKKKSTN